MRVRRCLVCAVIIAAGLLPTVGFAKDRPLTIRKSPFSSSSYRIWKEPRGAAMPRSVERVIRRNPPVAGQAARLEQQGGHFTSDGKAPYVKPTATRR